MDKYVTEDGIDCTFLRDLSRFDHQIENKETLEELLKDFFEYYSQFDFTEKAINLNEATTMTKPEFNAMYIVNPLEKGLNVSRNVSMEEVDRFKRECRNALWTLESQENKDLWGLLGLFENDKRKASLSSNSYAKQGRIMDVSTLFEEQEEPKIEYKNVEVKEQIDMIKKDTKQQIKTLEKGLNFKR